MASARSPLDGYSRIWVGSAADMWTIFCSGVADIMYYHRTNDWVYVDKFGSMWRSPRGWPYGWLHRVSKDGLPSKGDSLEPWPEMMFPWLDTTTR